MSTNSPIDEVRIGSVKAAIWPNQVGDEGAIRYNVTFGRLFRSDEDGKWKTTRSFGLNDLLVLSKLADQAHTRILQLREQNAEDDA